MPHTHNTNELRRDRHPRLPGRGGGSVQWLELMTVSIVFNRST